LYAVAIGLACFNYGQPMMISSFMFFFKGKPVSTATRNVVDIICVIAIVSGVACSLGTGAMQISSGLNNVLGVPINKLTWLLVIIAVVSAFVASSYSGIVKGIKFLSNLNMYLFIAVLVIIFLLGPSQYILSMTVESTAYLLQNFLVDINYSGYIQGQDWPIFWPIWLFVSAAAFAPMVGVFMGRISYGRSLREIIIGCGVMPGLFNLIWFNVFGATAFKMQTSGDFDIWGKIQSLGLESAMFEFFGSFPFGGFLVYLFMVVIFVSFVTLADSVTTSVSIITTDASTDILKKVEPAGLVKIVWGVLMGSTAYIFISFGGIEGAKMAALIGGFPILLLTLFVALCICRMLFGKISAQEKFSVKVDDDIG
jgi:choline-glycine betaine transporter